MILLILMILVSMIVLSLATRIDDDLSTYNHSDNGVTDTMQFSDLQSDSSQDLFGTSFATCSSEINPATGLPMCGGVDVMGNAYGMSSTFDDHNDMFSSNSFNDFSSSFDDHFSSSYSSFDS